MAPVLAVIAAASKDGRASSAVGPESAPGAGSEVRGPSAASRRRSTRSSAGLRLGRASAVTTPSTQVRSRVTPQVSLWRQLAPPPLPSPLVMLPPYEVWWKARVYPAADLTA